MVLRGGLFLRVWLACFVGLIAFTTGIGLFYLSSCDFVGGVCVFCSASGFFWLMLAGLAVWVCGFV